MRDDFAKVLVERPRFGHDRSFKDVRHKKDYAENEMYFGGRESMKKRYDTWSDRKEFNENLNPLKGWLRTCIGKNWNKCYSELRKKFDARSVINNHILEHLFQYVEIHTFIDEHGRTVVHDPSPYSSPAIRPIAECYKDFYVCPKNGTLKVTQKLPKKSLKAINAQRSAEALAEKFRQLNDREVLHKIDGIWYHFDLKPIPKVEMIYVKPHDKNEFKLGYALLGKGLITKTWDELNGAEREKFGIRRVGAGVARDELTDESVYTTETKGTFRDGKPAYYKIADIQKYPGGLYHANKKTASKKLLRAAGLVGSTAANDSTMSHREHSKYRKAA